MFDKIKVLALEVQSIKVNLVETGFIGDTNLVVRYSASSNGLWSNSRVWFQRDVGKVHHILLSALYLHRCCSLVT